MSDHFLGDRKQALEDAFFRRQEAERIEALREELVHKNTVEELRKKSQFDNEKILEKLVQLGVNAETLTAVSLVPLIAVAWADNNVQEREREAILTSAKTKGIEAQGPAYELLNSWLTKRPSSALMDTWRDYIGALCESLDPKQTEMLRDQVVSLAKDVASTAGGLLGIHKVSANEQRVLDDIARAFSS